MPISHTIEVYTIQMAQWRKLKETGIEIVDTTIKSGNKELAPDWELFNDTKAGNVSAEEYTQRYFDLMRQRYTEDPKGLLELLKKNKIALACYCKEGTHCHRYLLDEILEKVSIRQGITYIRKGEFK